jgi:transcriptional regulator with XRE-family HTH domain
VEFNEKLQQLRKQNNLTQEQLAEQLYVSRTAVSKWESGKGYPNIESLKCLSKVFSVSIDELLSGNELITLAESENRSNINKINNLMYGILDLMAIAFIFLPFYGQQEGDFIRSVTLLAYSDTPEIIRTSYFVILILMGMLGAV